MSSSAKRRQTLAKVARERLVKERRALKQQRKEDRKQAAADAAAAPQDETPTGEDGPETAEADGD